MQTETTIRYYFTSVRMAFIKKQELTCVGQGVEKNKSLLQKWWVCKLVQALWKTLWTFLKKLKIEYHII